MGKDGNAEIKATRYGGYFKGNPPTDIDSSWGRGESIRRYVLDSDPNKIHSAGDNYHKFKNEFQAQGKGDDILQFLYKAGQDLDNAWYGNKSSAYIAQTHLSWLFEAAKELIEACDKVGTSLKGHSESLKSLRDYFSQTEGSPYNRWYANTFDDKSGLLSRYQQEVNKAIGSADPNPGKYDRNSVEVKTDVGEHKTEFEYKYLHQDGTPPETAKSPYAEISNQVARKRLKEHESNTGQQFDQIPYLFSITLPPDVIPASDTGKPPHDPHHDRGNPGDKPPHQQPPSGHPTGPGGPSTPHVPMGTPDLPKVSSGPPNGTDLSQMRPPAIGTPPHSNPISNPPTTNLPNTNYPTPPTLPPTSIPPGRLPQTGGRFPRTDTGLPRPGTRFPRVETGLPRGFEGPGGSPPPGARPGTSGTPAGPGGAAPGAGRSGVVGSSQVAAEEAALARTAQQAANRGGQGMMPFMPMGGAGMNGPGQEQHRQTFICEDEETWSPDDDATPPLIC